MYIYHQICFFLQHVEVKFDIACLWRDLAHNNLFFEYFYFFDNHLSDIQTMR